MAREPASYLLHQSDGQSPPRCVRCGRQLADWPRFPKGAVVGQRADGSLKHIYTHTPPVESDERECVPPNEVA